jgi:proline iminopeptidase
MQKREVDWFFYGIRNFFSEAWDTFANFIPIEERHDLLSAYLRIFRGNDETRRLEAIRTWAHYESSCSTLLPSTEGTQSMQDDQHRIGLALIEAHYFKHNLFTPDSRLLDNVGQIRRLPGVIVQGRYDMVCPILTADELHKHWPEADYRIIPDAGHSALEPGIRSSLIEATESFKQIRG